MGIMGLNVHCLRNLQEWDHEAVGTETAHRKHDTIPATAAAEMHRGFVEWKFSA